MKRLNKTKPDCPMNRRLRELYDLKQRINNSKMSDSAKQVMLKECDKEINLAWRNHYAHKAGYEISCCWPAQMVKLRTEVVALLQRLKASSRKGE